MSEDNKILVGIVTYNPDIKRLRECIEAIKSKIENIYVFDNNSNNIEEISLFVKNYKDRIYLHKNEVNAGVAKALSTIMDYASDNGYRWVLSLDQDSVIQSNIISLYKNAAKRLPKAGMITCLIKDRNINADMNRDINERQDIPIVKVPCCITSGSLTNVYAYKQTSGYDESFFIDSVDFDLCFSLREKGFRIYRINKIGLLHEVGHGEIKRFLWKKIIVFNEKPERIYYISRNKIKLYKKHAEYSLPNLIYRETEGLLKICFENERLKKLKMFIKGIFDGIMGK